MGACGSGSTAARGSVTAAAREVVTLTAAPTVEVSGAAAVQLYKQHAAVLDAICCNVQHQLAQHMQLWYVCRGMSARSAGCPPASSGALIAWLPVRVLCVAYNWLLQLEALLAQVDDWQFDSFKLAAASGNRPLSVLAFFLFKRSSLVKRVRQQRWLQTAPCLWLCISDTLCHSSSTSALEPN
jgi:hypothetical protein